MSTENASPRPPRCANESQLRSLRASELWKTLDDEARQALQQLLDDEILDGRGFDDELEAIFAEYTEVANTWDAFEALNRDVRGAPDSTPQDAEPSLQVADDRYLNLCLTWPLSHQIVPPERRLATGAQYEVRVDIGALSPNSLLRERASPFPDDLLEHSDGGIGGDWLEVTVVSDDFDVSGARHAMFLPRTGPSWVCPCPMGTIHVCDPRHRGSHLRIPVTAPWVPGPARLRLFVSYRGNQIQSVALTAEITSSEQNGGATKAAIDYTLTSGYTDLSALPPRPYGIRISRRPDGAVGVDIDGAGIPATTVWLNDLYMGGALRAARKALTTVHADPATGLSLLRQDNGKSPAEFYADLTALARVGWDLYLLIAPPFRDREASADAFATPGDIQVCRQGGQPIMFPWALVYDIPVESDGTLVPCDIGLQEVHAANSPRACPAQEKHTLNTLCPFGFWGFRHAIEQPPSRSAGQRLALLAGRGSSAPAMTMGRSLNLDEGLSTEHLRSLGESFGGRIIDCDGSAALRTALFATEHDCVYFYCHALKADGQQADPEATVLQIGRDDRVTTSTIVAWARSEDSWSSTRPLVFLNGCHTVDRVPSTWLSYVDVFTVLDAAGVVGTEISVSQSLANEVAERFWGRFLGGETVGQALHQTRLDLLRKGNVLGLAYTAYCSNELRLRTQPGSTDE